MRGRVSSLILLVFASALTPSLAYGGICNGFKQLGLLQRIFGKAEDFVDPFLAKPLDPKAPRPVSTSEATLNYDAQARILPFFNAGAKGTFKGKDGVPIHYGYWEAKDPKGTILLLHGAGESMSLHMELLFNLHERGYNVYSMDERGHGHSGRMTSDPGRLHVNRFGDYVDDVGTLSDVVMKPNGHAKYHVIGISMGGQVAAQHALRRPQEVEKLFLSTPMLEIQFPFFMASRVTLAMTGVLKWLGRATEYAPGELPPSAVKHREDDSRHSSAYKMRSQLEEPDIPVHGASVQWVFESTLATLQTWNKLRDLPMPVFLAKAGQDKRVRNKTIEEASLRIPNAKLINYEEAPHSLLRTPDATRDKVMRDLFEFLEDSGTAGSGSAGDAP
jgi:lysophospholipase